MFNMGSKWLLLCSILLCCGVLASGKITHRSVEKATRRWIQVEMPFGFAPGGVVRLKVSNIKIEQEFKEGNREKDFTEFETDQMGFYITTITSLDRTAVNMQINQCETKDDKYIKPVLKFNAPTVENVMAGTEDSCTKDWSIKEPGMYMLFFAQCGEPDVMVSFDVRVEMYNSYVTSSGKKVKDYLSVGERELPIMYMVRACYVLCPLLLACCIVLCIFFSFHCLECFNV